MNLLSDQKVKREKGFIDDIVFVKNVDSDTQHTSNKTSYEIKIKD